MCGVPVQRADDYLQRLIAPRPPRRRLRADRGSGRGAEARRASRSCGATWCASSRPAPSPRTRCSMPGRNNYLAGGRPRPAVVGRRATLRPRLGRHLDRRVPRRRGRRRPARRRARAARPARDPRRRRALRRCRACRRSGASSAARDAARPRRSSTPRPPSGGSRPSSASRRSTASARSRAPSWRPPPPSLAYVERTQLGARPPLAPPQREAPGADHARSTRRPAPISNCCARCRASAQGSLLAAIDRTVTGAGARLLADRLASPLTDPAAIDARLDAVGLAGRRSATCARDLRGALRACARHRARAVAPRARPRRPARSRRARATASTAAARRWPTLRRGAPRCRPSSRAAARDLAAPGPGARGRARARRSADELPLLRATAASCAPAIDAELDEPRALRDESRAGDRRPPGALCRGDRRPVAEDPAQQHARLFRRGAGASTASSCSAPPLQRQPSSTARPWPARMRFTTAELAELEARIATAADRALAHRARDLRRAGGARSRPRATPSRRRRARSPRSTSRPRSPSWPPPRTGRGRVVDVARLRDRRRPPSGGRAGAAPRRRAFVANDCDLSPPTPAGEAGRIWLVTGPNMAGKSTFLRQNALIAVLAQIGLLRAGATRPHRRRRPAVLAASAPPTTSRAAARPSWSRWSRPPPSSTRRRRARWSSSTRSAAAPRPSTACPSPGRAVEHLHEVNRCRALFATHYPRADRAVGAAAAARQRHDAGARNGRARSSSCTRWRPAPPTAPTASRWPSSPACRRPWSARARGAGASWRRATAARPSHRLADDLPLFAAARPKPPQPAASGRA